MNENNQSETAESNETTKEKVAGGLEAVGERLDGLGFRLLRVAALLGVLYLPAAAVIDRLPIPELTDLQVVFIGSYLVFFLILYLPTAKGIDRIWKPQKEVVAKIDGASQSVLDAWYGSPDLADDMECEDGIIRTKNIRGRVVHLVNDFEPEENTAKAPRKMEIPDWELWGEKEAIERQRHRNNALVEFGKQLFIRLPAMGQKLEGQYWKKMSKKKVEKELTDPESFLSSVEEELPDLEPEVTEEMRAAVDEAQPSETGDSDE